MRPDPFDTNRSSAGSQGDREPYAYERERLSTERERLRQKYERERDGDAFEPYDDRDATPPYAAPRRKRPIGRWILRGFGIGIVLLVIAIIWLAITAPLSKSLQPPTPPSITLTADDGTPIARRGAIIGKSVDAAKLPPHVT